MSDFLKICKTIKSCKTTEQSKVAMKMIKLFEKKYPDSINTIRYLKDLMHDKIQELYPGV